MMIAIFSKSTVSFPVHVITFIVLAAAFITTSAGCDPKSENGPAREPTEADLAKSAFFDNLSNFCGKTLHGETIYPDDPDHELVGRHLVMKVETCDEQEIRIPFHVGDDTSRTWVITKLEDGGLKLTHDHRNEDGTPFELTNYGGYADDKGDEWTQMFPADEATREMLPEASTNVWRMKIDTQRNTFIYDIRRHNAPRYRAEFSIPVEN